MHGCFWHRHSGCGNASDPKSRVRFWKEKFDRNVARDELNLSEIRRLGWRTIVVWECELIKNPHVTAEEIYGAISGRMASKKEVYGIPDKREILRAAENRSRLFRADVAKS